VQHVKKIQYVYLFKNIYKMGCLEGTGVPVLYIGRTVTKVNVKNIQQTVKTTQKLHHENPTSFSYLSPTPQIRRQFLKQTVRLTALGLMTDSDMLTR
jgi:hypothetical protein